MASTLILMTNLVLATAVFFSLLLRLNWQEVFSELLIVLTIFATIRAFFCYTSALMRNPAALTAVLPAIRTPTIENTNY